MARNSSRLPQRFDPDAPLFLISTAARLAGMHPQTLRTYDRLGLVVPHRTAGRGRRYTLRDIERLRMVQYLSQDEGINLEGVARILGLQAQVDHLQRQVIDLAGQIQALRQSGPAAGRVFAVSGSDIVWLRGGRGNRQDVAASDEAAVAAS
jgi:MerR family transcriptional regulator/heat shock protein HspR